MKRLIVLLAALLATWVGTAATATAAVVPTNSEVVHGYTYDSHQHAAGPSVTVTGRGPPGVAYDYTAFRSAIDSSSRGASARPQPWPTWSYTTYDHAGRSTRADSGGATSRPDAEARRGDPQPVAGASVAAKTAPEVAKDIGHAGIHQFPGTLAGKSQFFDDVDLGALASRTKGMDGFLQTNGNTRYVLRNPGGVGVDRTTGLPTDVFTVIRRSDGSVVTMFPGTSPKG